MRHLTQAWDPEMASGRPVDRSGIAGFGSPQQPDRIRRCRRGRCLSSSPSVKCRPISVSAKGWEVLRRRQISNSAGGCIDRRPLPPGFLPPATGHRQSPCSVRIRRRQPSSPTQQSNGCYPPRQAGRLSGGPLGLGPVLHSSVDTGGGGCPLPGQGPCGCPQGSGPPGAVP